MNSFIRVSLLGAALAATPAFAHETMRCDALEDGVGMRIGIDADFDFDGDDLRFRDDGETVMMITNERELFLHGKQVELDANGRELVDRYYTTVEDFVGDAMDLAGDAAGLGVSAAVEALVAVVTGHDEMNRFEKRIEARAAEIEAQADRMCQRFNRLENIEHEMQKAVPGFEPLLFTAQSD